MLRLAVIISLVSYGICNVDDCVDCTNGVINVELYARHGTTEERTTSKKCCVDAATIQSNKGCGYRNKKGIGFRILGDADSETEYGLLS